MEYKFQVNLRGIIDLLSMHLYSSPQVYLRELLQNSVDAVQARLLLDPDHQGEITFDLVPPKTPDGVSTLIVQDDGVGLTVDEVHQFLATIGESSKRGTLEQTRQQFIGQFGIGLLSCFIVSDEIVLVTRSCKGDSPAMQWIGRPDGTYTVRELTHEVSPGTQVYLRAKAGKEEFFEPGWVRKSLAHFGGFLPHKISFAFRGQSELVNEESPPWKWEFAGVLERRQRLLEWGKKVFDQGFLDAIPIHSETGDVDGVAFILPYSPNYNSKTKHRVYLKGMFLTDSAEDLLPDWAFFAKCVVNAQDLRPTASRESLFEDGALAQCRTNLGHCLRAYLLRLARHEPKQLEYLLRIHNNSIKLLSMRDDECFKVFGDWIRFETSRGELRLGDMRKLGETIHYTTRVDLFRELSRVAEAQGLLLVNGGYVYTRELIERLPQVYPEVQIGKVESNDFLRSFGDLAHEEILASERFLDVANEVLHPQGCAAEIKKFQPVELPTLYCTNDDVLFRRELEHTQHLSNELWNAVLEQLKADAEPGQIRLCFNFGNALVRKLMALPDTPLLRRSIEMLYIQALLLGRHPLSGKEMQLLNDGLLGLIDFGISGGSGLEGPTAS